ncbi:MAG: ELM1/GtrOC1 family putative glycosyltransferase [Methylovulum miyakonense]|uniref:ELM1/GtrOC1 family putative glycosyltransferase n=1 Tax=Methylovulum miyakonense TaxID=645578 RepID=UPI003BB48CAE
MTANPIRTTPLVWVVDSAYTGELHARIGLAERLGFGYGLIPIPDDDPIAYGQMLQERYRQEGNGYRPPLLIISGTGEETTEQIANLRHWFPGQLLTIYLASILPDERHPRLAEYDLIASPQLSGNNIITLVGVPHQLTRENLTLAYQQHADYFGTLPKPIIGVLVGGNTRYCDGFTETHARHLAERVAKTGNALGGCLVITNSRRTPAPALAVFLDGLSGLNPHFFDWRQLDNTFYHALLAHADLFIVTGDSLSMCSEAAFTGKPLLVDLSNTATECYHRQIVGGLIEHGAARLLTDTFEPWSYTPPDPTGAVVNEIYHRFLEDLN